MRRKGRVLGIACAFLLLAGSARAEPIQITAGGFIWIPPIASTHPIAFSGGDFAFSGFGAGTGVFLPYLQCGVPECLAGTTVDLRSHWSGGDLRGTVTYNGTTYAPIGGQSQDAAGLLAEWNGSLTIPAGFTGGALSAPFTFTGRFSGPAGSSIVTFLTGHGTATLHFDPYPPDLAGGVTGALRFQSASYLFDASAPVQEPASLVLIGSGLAGVAALRRRRGRGVS
jgi:hypothetical protein